MLWFWLWISIAPNVILWVNEQCNRYGNIKESGHLWYICTNCFSRWYTDIIPTGQTWNKLLVYCTVIDKWDLQVPIKIKDRDKVRAIQSQHLQDLDQNTSILLSLQFLLPGQPHACSILFPCLQPQQLQFHQGTILWQRMVLEHWQFLTFPREKGLPGHESL